MGRYLKDDKSYKKGVDAVMMQFGANQYKIILTGNGAVGKTSLLNRYFTGHFDRSVGPTIGVNAKTENVEPIELRARDSNDSGIMSVPDSEDDSETYQYWDLGGQRMFDQIRPAYIAGAHGIMLCFNLNDERSLLKSEGHTDDDASIGRFLKELIRTLGQDVKTIPIILVGTKADLERSVKDKTIRAVASLLKERGLNIVSYIDDEMNGLQVYGKWSTGGDEFLWERGQPYLVTSAKEGTDCKLAFRVVQMSVVWQKRANARGVFDSSSGRRVDRFSAPKRKTTSRRRRPGWPNY